MGGRPEEEIVEGGEDVLDNLDIKQKPKRKGPEKPKEGELRETKIRYKPKDPADYTEPQIYPSDYVTVTQEIYRRRKSGQPPIREDEQACTEAINTYLERCFEKKKVLEEEPIESETWNVYVKQKVVEKIVMKSLPTVTGIAFFLWLDRRTLLNYCKKEEYFPAVIWFVRLVEQMTIQEWMKWNLNTKIISMLLTNNYGYRDSVKDKDDEDKWFGLWDIIWAIMQANEAKREMDYAKQKESITPWEAEKASKTIEHIDISQKQETQWVPMVWVEWDKNAPAEKHTPTFYRK